MENSTYFVAAYKGTHMRSYYNAFTRAQALDYLRRSCMLLREFASENRAAYNKLCWIDAECAIESIGTTVNPVSIDNTYTCASWRFVLAPL